MPLTIEDRRRNGRKGALTTLLNSPNWSALTAPARAAGPASLDWHAQRIDPDGKFPPEQRAKLATIARKNWYEDLADRSREARAARRAAQAPAPVAAAAGE